MGKKVIGIVMLLILCINVMAMVSFEAEASNDICHEKATNFYSTHIGEELETYDANMTIGRIVNFYNLNEEIVAKMYIFKNNENYSDGYVLINYNSIEIIEFAFWGGNFVESFEEQNGINQNEVEYYYFGGYQYVAAIEEDNVRYVSLLNNMIVEDVSTMSYISSTEKIAVRGERALSSSTTSVAGYNQSYYITSYFNDINNCAPTAGTNLCVYYYNRGQTNIQLNNSWDSSYNEIYDCMRTTSGGTAPIYIKGGIEDYITDRGYNCSSYNITADPFGYAISEIDYGRPSLVCMEGDSTYGNHVVLALGYKIESGTTYLLVADGLHSTANRYINNNSSTVKNCIAISI